MAISINAPNAVLNTAYTANSVNHNVLIGILVTIISAFNAIQSASIVMGLFLINAPVAHLRNSFLINNVFLPALMATL
jgi:hypothetical protein